MNEMTKRAERETLARVGAALRQGDRSKARALLAAVLQHDPRSVAAWGWACQAAETDAERIACLRRIVEIDPGHAAAQRYLAQLQPPDSIPAAPLAAPVPPSGPDAVYPAVSSHPRPRPANRLLALLAFLLELPAAYVIGALVLLGLLVTVVYVKVNHDWFGLAEPDWDRLAISSSIETIQSDEQTWKIVYENTEDSRFAGLVRHASLIRFDRVPFLTHDILVTSGDYADPERVKTSVIDHHFLWRSPDLARPEGAINLLHTMAVSQDIYRQLLQVRTQDRVAIVGREILRVEVYDRNGVYLGDWHDTGCNTLLVRSIEIVSR
ncbi:MAG: tetratricopeptide repeat protein [Anaerolineae bacterium]|nr:tetratricopeptide repeat protein [Anaerolineae bacterium]